jgi:hypothetical protein
MLQPEFKNSEEIELLRCVQALKSNFVCSKTIFQKIHTNTCHNLHFRFKHIIYLFYCKPYFIFFQLWTLWYAFCMPSVQLEFELWP